MKSIKVAVFVLIIGVVFTLTGVSFSLFNKIDEGVNKELIAGDIWMKYTGSNQIELSDMIPSTAIKILTTYSYTSYTVNKNMTEEQINVCIDENNYADLKNGETPEAFCRGMGTLFGKTIEETYNKYFVYVEDELVKEKVIFKNNKISPKRIFYTKLEYNYEVTEEEIEKCLQIEFHFGLDEGVTKEEYCRGIGTIDGKTLIEKINDYNKGEDDFQAQYEFSPFIVSNVIVPVIDMPYFEFIVSGKNTYEKKDIWYEIMLNHGDSHKVRTTRINDEDLRFTLLEFDENGDVLDVHFNKQKYFDLQNKTIWVDKISANSRDEINKIYRLYMNIAEDIVVGNVDYDYTIDEWNDIFASIDVEVNGDFTKKELEATDESCFYYSDTYFYIRNENMSEEELGICENYFSDYINDIEWLTFQEGTTARSFCEGTGKVVNYDSIFDYDAIYNFQDFLNKSYDYDEEFLMYLKSNNIIIEEIGIEINGYDETCGSNVIIPSKINNLNVLNLSGFGYKKLTHVTIPSGVRSIDQYAFSDNNIKSVRIPSSVYFVDFAAFTGNFLSSVIIEDGVKVIGGEAFTKNPLLNVTLPSSIELYYCDSFSDTVVNYPNNFDCTNFEDNVTYYSIFF